MCKLKSGIITYKNRTAICDLDTDSHEDLIKKAGVKDDSLTPNFVRVELLPKDGNIFNHKINNWKLKVDQDVIPDWFDEKKAKELMIEPLKETFEKRFIVNKRRIKIIEKGRYFVKNSRVEAYGDSEVRTYGDSDVEGWENSKIKAYGSSEVLAFENSKVWAYENSKIRADSDSGVEAQGNSKVRAFGDSKVRAFGDSKVRAYENSKIGAYDYSQIEACGHSEVGAFGISEVKAYEYSLVKAWGHSKVRAYGESRIEAFEGVEVCSSENSTVRRYIKFKRK